MSASNRRIIPLETKLLGRLQFWLFDRNLRRLPNAISTVRYWLWYWTGGRHTHV